MAQFDVHRNVGRYQDGIPFVVVAQSRLFDDYRRRVVIPLVRKTELSQIPNPRCETVSVANEQLGERVGSLAEEGDAIVAALDELFTRAFG